MKRAVVVFTAVGLGLGSVFVTASQAVMPTCYRTTNLPIAAHGPTPVPWEGTTAASTNCVMGIGATGAAVRRLQQTLNPGARRSVRGPYPVDAGLLNTCTRLKLIWADSGHEGRPLAEWVHAVARITLQVIKRTNCTPSG